MPFSLYCQVVAKQGLTRFSDNQFNDRKPKGPAKKKRSR